MMQINLRAFLKGSIIMQWTFALTDIIYANEILILIYFRMDIFSAQCNSTFQCVIKAESVCFLACVCGTLNVDKDNEV